MEEKLSYQTSIERERAKFAYECAMEGSKIEKNKEYKAYVKKILTLIKTNGLLATFAFVSSKAEKDSSKSGYAYNLIYNQTIKWLSQEPVGIISDRLKGKDMVRVFTELNSSQYRAVTNEVLTFFVWLKRFAEALIKGD